MSENYEANNQDLKKWWASSDKTSAGTWSYFLNNIVGTRRSGADIDSSAPGWLQNPGSAAEIRAYNVLPESYRLQYETPQTPYTPQVLSPQDPTAGPWWRARSGGERQLAVPTSPDIPQDPLMNEFAFLRNAGGQAYGGDSAQGYGESVPEELSPMALHEINMRDPKYALDHTKRNFGNGVWRTQAEWDALPESYRLQYETPASPETPPELTHDEIMDRISKHTSKMMQEQRACEEAGRKWSISGNYCAPADARAVAL